MLCTTIQFMVDAIIALNVGRIIVQEKEMFQRGEEVGYFNLGSTIVMIFEAPEVAEWVKREGEAVRYG